MVIQIDTREKQRAIKKIINFFDEMDIHHITSKLYVGDYMIYGHPEIVVDRKQNLGELAGNICSTQKDKDGNKYSRLREELKKAKEVNTHVIILIEDDNINNFEDVKKWTSKHTKIKGETLYKAMKTIESEKEKYDVEFKFCKKEETGQKIIELLLGDPRKYLKED
jgi:ERCC4-type nuclease